MPIHTLVQNDETITVQNCGSEDMTLAAPEISPQGPFHITNQALPKQLAPTETGTLQVLFAPVEKGTFDATLTVSTSKGDLVVPLHGDGIVTPGSGSMTPQPPPPDGCGCHSGDAGGNALVTGMMCAALARRRRRRPSIT